MDVVSFVYWTRAPRILCFWRNVLEMLEGVLDAVGVELDDIAGGRLRGWRDDGLRLWTQSVPASTCVVGLIVW